MKTRTVNIDKLLKQFPDAAALRQTEIPIELFRRTYKQLSKTREVTVQMRNKLQENSFYSPYPENLSLLCARTTLPIQVVGSTGCGKTTFLIDIARQILSEQPTARVIVLDGKPTEGRWNKEVSSNRLRLISLNTYLDVPDIHDELHSLYFELTESGRNEHSEPIYFICDELNNIYTNAHAYALVEQSQPKHKDDKKKYKEAIQAYIKLLLTQGREKRFLSIASTHDAGTETMGISASERNNWRFVVLSNDDSQDNIKSLLSPTGIRILQQEERAILSDYFDIWQPRGVYFALTNLGGASSYRFVLLERPQEQESEEPKMSEPVPVRIAWHDSPYYLIDRTGKRNYLPDPETYRIVMSDGSERPPLPHEVTLFPTI